MGKTGSTFCCQQCGYQSPKWMGRCPGCNAWNSLAEEVQKDSGPQKVGFLAQGGGEALPITGIAMKHAERITTGWKELDRILGGGLVPGSVILLGGEPGIGKSTLLLQVLSALAESSLRVLYLSGEESPAQIRMRAERIGIRSDSLYSLSENHLEKALEAFRKLSPRVVVVDSIQTLFTSSLSSIPGSISQVRETALRLISFSKREGIVCLIIGHVTKEGTIAGPRVLEHMVDTVLYFEGEGRYPYRLLRAIKNRFGSTNEMGVFEMKDRGLCEVPNPSEWFLAERPVGAAGSVVVPSLEGTRPILVELQALATPSGFSMPKRTTTGVDPNRVSLAVAVLEKKVGMDLSHQDIFINVAGGVKIMEPALDLGIISSIASSFMDRPIDSKTVVVGEIGLAGEIRGIHKGELRAREAAKMGFNRCLLPRTNAETLKAMGTLELIGVSKVEEVINLLF